MGTLFDDFFIQLLAMRMKILELNKVNKSLSKKQILFDVSFDVKE
jgi:hypothetical protein